MLHDSEIYAKYQKWLGGISKVRARVRGLKEEQQTINDQINDNIDPDEMVDLHIQLQQKGKDIESAEVVKKQFTDRKPFTKSEFVNDFNEHISELGEKLKDPLEKAMQARAVLREALSEYLKAHQEYSHEYAQERARWEALYRDVDDDYQNYFNVFRQFKDAEYLKTSLFEEIKYGPVLRGNKQTTEVYGE